MDKSGQCAGVHAALRGHAEILQYLLDQDWSSDPTQSEQNPKSRVVQQAFIAASSMGHVQVTHTHTQKKKSLTSITSRLIWTPG